MPPQSPVERAPTGKAEVNTIGLSAVPTAMILAPRVMINDPLLAFSPFIKVPASMVSVAPLVT